MKDTEILAKELAGEVVYLKRSVIDVLDLTSEYSDFFSDYDYELTYEQYKNEIKKQVKRVFYDPESKFVFAIFPPHDYVDLDYIDHPDKLTYAFIISNLLLNPLPSFPIFLLNCPIFC